MSTKQNKNKHHFAIFKVIIGVFMFSSLVIGCNNTDDRPATLHVMLTDAPADFQQVNIDIQGVEVHNGVGDENSGWRALELSKGVYNLLEFSNGLDTLLGRAEVPAGKISKIRLILGTQNSVMVGGDLFALSTPSAQQSGLKLNLNAQLKPGVIYTIVLDFDAAMSVVEQGNGTYSLKPVIRAISEATSGAISGTVDPILASPAVFATVGNDTVATTYTDATGSFLLRGVPAGIYTVSFDPKAGYVPMQVDNVNVSIGNITNIGAVVIL
jgi:hypothetical protein